MEDRELMEKELLLIKGASDLYLHGVYMVFWNQQLQKCIKRLKMR